MKRNSLTLALALMAVVVPAARAQDLHKFYRIGAGASISIQNVSGAIRISGYGGDTVTVDAVANGRDRQVLEIEDLSTSDKVSLRVKYPQHAGSIDAWVEFDVRVPATVNYNFDAISSVSGNIEVSGVRGRLNLNSVSGTVKASEITGTINAKSVSGNVVADISSIEGTGNMDFSSVSGSVSVTAPGTLGADITMSTLSGSLDTNFPLQIQQRTYGPGRSAHGTVGAHADFSLRLSTISGKVSLNGK